MANVHLAMKQKLTIIPVINKIDLPHADVPTVKKQLEDILAIPAEEAILASAKTGIGIEEILEAIVQRIPPPKPMADGKLRALVFDSISTSIAASSPTCVFSREAGRRAGSQAAADRQTLRGQGGRHLHAEAAGSTQARGGRRRLFHRQYQERRRRSRWATPSPTSAIRARPLPGFRRFIRWCSAGFIPSTPPISSI